MAASGDRHRQAGSDGAGGTTLPAIVQYWHDPEPPDEVRAALASFAERNPGWRHAVFDESTAAEFLAEHYSPREVAAFRSCALPAMQADYFRYCAVHVLAGVYADADFRCIADLGSMLGEDRSGIVFGRPPDRITAVFNWPYPVGRYGAVSNDLFAFREPGHILLGTAIEVATANIEMRVADGPQGVWLTAGPGVFTAMYVMHRLGSVDAFVRYAAGTVLEPSAQLFCEIVEDPRELSSMFASIDIQPRSARRAWVQPVELPRPDSGPEVYWPNVTGSVFR